MLNISYVTKGAITDECFNLIGECQISNCIVCFIVAFLCLPPGLCTGRAKQGHCASCFGFLSCFVPVVLAATGC